MAPHSALRSILSLLFATSAIAAGLTACAAVDASESFGPSKGAAGATNPGFGLGHDGGVSVGKETCGNGLDDDGNGKADDGCSCTKGAQQNCFLGRRSSAGKGACTLGIQHCDRVSGTAEFPVNQWGDCTGSGTPSAELCGNSRDDDCDGTTDEGCACSEGSSLDCSNSCGPGKQLCSGGLWGTCAAQQPLPEVCDGVDNNCNGLIDEGLTRQCQDACGQIGTQVCVNGAYPDTCTITSPSAENCGDGIDNDCNGFVDCSDAVCAGLPVCQNGGTGGSGGASSGAAGSGSGGSYQPTCPAPAVGVDCTNKSNCYNPQCQEFVPHGACQGVQPGGCPLGQVRDLQTGECRACEIDDCRGLPGFCCGADVCKGVGTCGMYVCWNRIYADYAEKFQQGACQGLTASQCGYPGPITTVNGANAFGAKTNQMCCPCELAVDGGQQCNGGTKAASTYPYWCTACAPGDCDIPSCNGFNGCPKTCPEGEYFNGVQCAPCCLLTPGAAVPAQCRPCASSDECYSLGKGYVCHPSGFCWLPPPW